MTNPIVHFEIPADDTDRAKNFYEKTFDWKIRFDKDTDYYMINTKEDCTGIDGGMMKRKMPGQPFMNYITVSSVDEFMKKIKKNGGDIVMKKTPIGMNMGAIAAFKDTEGNIIGLHEMPIKAK
jgi:uncharacterized protein